MNVLRTGLLLAVLVAYWFSDKIVPAMYRAKPGSEVEAPELHRIARNLAAGDRRIPLDANPGTAHLFIVNPLRGGGWATLFSTHPPIGGRVARREAMAGRRLVR